MLKVGDKVELIKGNYLKADANPLGVEGEVSRLFSGAEFCYYVHWNNGEWNEYRKGELKLVDLETIMDRYLEDHNGTISA